MDNENKAPDEEKKNVGDGVPDVPHESEETPKAETAAETLSEAPTAQTEETTPETAEKTEEGESEPVGDGVRDVPKDEVQDTAAELEQLRAENARLKAQLEAHGAGFKPAYIEDAVLIAENAANRDSITIAEALQAVAKKYPEWKYTPGDKPKGGFKVGAEAPKEENATEDDKLNEAFGIHRKK